MIDITSANKAPGGYGLGSDSGHLITAADDLDTIIKNGVYQWGDYLPKNAPMKYCKMRVWCGAGWASQETMSAYASEKDSIRRRVLNNGMWGPWDWVNPPMQVGVEYRTTERYLRKPVYCKVVDFGTAPNNDTKNVSLSGMNIDEVCDAIFHYYVPRNGENGVMTCHPQFTGLLVSNGVIQIRTNADKTDTNFYVTLKYTKTTD